NLLECRSDDTTLVENRTLQLRTKTVREVAVGVRPVVAMRERIRRAARSLVAPKFTSRPREYKAALRELGEPCPRPRRRRAPLSGPMMLRDRFRGGACSAPPRCSNLEIPCVRSCACLVFSRS